MTDNEEDYLQKIRHVLQESEHTQPVSPMDDEKVRDARTDRGLRSKYANWMILILISQLLLLNLIFILSGAGLLTYSDRNLQIFMSGTLLEIFGIVTVITRYLFPRQNIEQRNKEN